jgi:tetratricopeptide (TPR) repeat protein
MTTSLKILETQLVTLEALALFEALDDLAGQSDIYGITGEVYRQLGNFPEALAHFLKQLQRAEAKAEQRAAWPRLGEKAPAAWIYPPCWNEWPGGLASYYGPVM